MAKRVKTPEDRARAKSRIHRHGDYRGHVWGDIMNVSHKDDATVLESLYDKGKKGKPGDLTKAPPADLRGFVETVGGQHEAGVLPPFTGNKSRKQMDEEAKDAEFASQYDLEN